MAAKPEHSATDGNQQQEFVIQRLYVKDLSFESPNTPHMFREEWKPKIELELNTQTQSLADDVHEVVLRVIVTAKVEDKTAFLAEAHQAGIFTIRHFDPEQLQQILGSYCPNLLFPYLREVVSDVIIKGGFPQFNLAPVNFDALYQQHLQQANAGSQDADGKDDATDN